MNTILFTSSTKQYNDAVVAGLIHFTLREQINETEPAYAAYHPEEKRIEITLSTGKEYIETDHLKKRSSWSARYDCVRQLIHRMKPGDCLNAHSLSDLGDSAEEAENLYFLALGRGITLQFYDMSYLDTTLHLFRAEPSADEKRMIRRMISRYYSQREYRPVLNSDEMRRVAEMPGTKKKSPDR